MLAVLCTPLLYGHHCDHDARKPKYKAKEKAKKAPQLLPQQVPKSGRKGKGMSDVEKGVITALWWV